MNEPGFRFKEGKLYAFSEESVMILEAWPVLKALRKENDSYWQEFDPRFRVVQPYRPRKPKPTPQLELGLGAIPVKSSISEQRRRAFDGFRFTMPKPVAAATEKFQSRQWGLLKLMQKSESALELAGINPVLCFALANYRPFRGRSTTIEGAAIANVISQTGLDFRALRQSPKFWARCHLSRPAWNFWCRCVLPSEMNVF